MRVPLLSAAIYIATCIPIVFASELHSGDSVQNSLRPGATEAYSLNLQAGDLVSLEFAATGQDVILTVLNPAGDAARRFSSKLLDGQSVAFYAPQSGVWQINLSGRNKDSECGYKISGLKITKSEALLKSSVEVQSPRLKQLTDAASVAKFWSQIEKEGAPLIEPLPDDPRNMLVTIVWKARSETKGVMIQSQFCDGESCFMKHLVNTDLWYASFKINRHVRTYYSVVLNVSAPLEIADGQYSLFASMSQRDPLNPKGWFEDSEDPDVPLHHGVSRLEMPDAPAQPWADKREDVPEGQVEKHSLTSALLKNTRDVWVYTPPGYSKTAPPYGLLLVFDGDTYIKVVPTPVTLDNLIADQRVPPLVAVMIGNAPHARSTELPCNPTFAEFLSAELVPWLRRLYNVSSDPRQVTIGGSSYGGLAATYAAYRHPEVFGNVLSQSGSYWWTPPIDPSKPSSFDPDSEHAYVAGLFMDSPRLPIRFYLDAGSLEVDRSGGGGSILVPNRDFRNVLISKGYEVHYQQFQGAHDYLSWRGTLADGLILLMDSRAQRQP
jgi:enterochelin esterase-like enzyme